MAGLERRKKLTIDQVNVYWRRLKDGLERPDLHMLCNAIRTLDLALAESSPPLCKRLSANVWARIRNDCFDLLVTSFPGHFIVYHSGVVVESGTDWPASGSLEFYPSQMKRREDSFDAELQRVHSDIIVRLRWCFAEGRNDVQPQDFTAFRHGIADQTADEQEQMLNELFFASSEEATKLKKIAHRQWWRLQSEVSNCADRRHKSELKKQMDQLEFVWGRS
ncbi:MAG TPA: hypothetical protein V6C72_12000 [Chroococcales cyanobacterium]